MTAPENEAAAGGGNPFWEASNLFSQSNKDGVVSSQQLGTAVVDGGGNINPGNYMRDLRLMIRTVTAGVAGTATADYPANILSRMGLQTTGGSEILFGVIGGYAYLQAHRFMRPWLQDPTAAYDYAASVTSPSITMHLMPEVRQQLGALPNTDPRAQYSWTQTINTYANVITGGTTAPVISVTPYTDMWAQPDAKDLEGVPNELIPPGINLQVKLRHQTFTLNAAGSDNNMLSTLTGNAVRCQLLIVRDSTGARQDYLSNPIQWQLDQRNLGTLSPDMIFQWAEDFYKPWGGVTRPTGVYVFPRFYNPGDLYGQGWLQTSNTTAESWDSATLSTGANLPGTVELLQEEVYAVGAVDPSLISL